MTEINLIGKPKSTSSSVISKEVGIPIYKKGAKAEVIVNYGLAGLKMDAFRSKFPDAWKLPMLNRYVGCSKFRAVQEAFVAGILVPESVMSLPLLCKKEDWIEKKVNSSKGLGIQLASRRKSIPGKYYQRLVPKKYELRVYAFDWIKEEDWKVHKRVGDPSKIAWNFHQGGKFESISSPTKYRVFREAIDVSKKILSIRRMCFGAVDFIVTPGNEVYFIEINSSHGFTNFSKGIYIEAFTKLKSLSKTELIKLAQR